MPAMSGVLENYAPVLIPLIVGVASAWGAVQIYKEKIAHLQKDVDDLKKDYKELRDKVIKSETCLQERGTWSPFFQRKSPVSLTKEGQELLRRSGGKLFVTENFSELFARIDEKHPKTAYDVQALSRTVLEGYAQDDRLVPIKEFAFNEGYELELLLTVMGIELRDLALKKKGWNTGDVDKSDPRLSEPGGDSPPGLP